VASTVSEEFSVDPALVGFLRQLGAQSYFRTVCELVTACFPEAVHLDVALQEDPDESGRIQVVLCVTLPQSYPDDWLHAARCRYHERLVEEVPLSRCPLFALVVDFASE
jgi:hypothetical protein